MEVTKAIKTIKSKKKMSTEVMTKIKLTREDFNRLKELFLSPDKENATVALATLENCDIKASMPIILTLYKAFNEKITGGWVKEAPKLTEAMEKAGIMLEGKMTINKIWTFCKGKYSQEDCNIFLDEAAALMETHFRDWGFTFLKDVQLKLVIRD